MLRRTFFATEITAAVALFATQAPNLEGPICSSSLMLLALTVVADLHPIQIYGNSYVSVGMAITIALIVLFGVPGVIIAAPLEAAAGALPASRFDFRAIHNCAMFVVVYSAAGATYGAHRRSCTRSLQVELLVAALAALAVSFGLTSLILAIVLESRCRPINKIFLG